MTLTMREGPGSRLRTKRFSTLIEASLSYQAVSLWRYDAMGKDDQNSNMKARRGKREKGKYRNKERRREMGGGGGGGDRWLGETLMIRMSERGGEGLSTHFGPLFRADYGQRQQPQNFPFSLFYFLFTPPQHRFPLILHNDFFKMCPISIQMLLLKVYMFAPCIPARPMHSLSSAPAYPYYYSLSFAVSRLGNECLWRMSCTVLLFPSLSAALGTTYILGFTRRPRDPNLASVQLNTVQASSVDPPSFITEYSMLAAFRIYECYRLFKALL